MVFTTPEIKIEKVILYHFGGQVVKNVEQEAIQQGRIGIGTLTPGIYIVEIMTSEGMINKKLIVH